MLPLLQRDGTLMATTTVFHVTVAGGRKLFRSGSLHRSEYASQISDLLDRGYTVFIAVGGTPGSVAVKQLKDGSLTFEPNGPTAERYVKQIRNSLRLGGVR